jgi:hypothetical protein
MEVRIMEATMVSPDANAAAATGAKVASGRR